FGVIKRCFQLLMVSPEYDLMTQAKMVLAICVLHNFICIFDSNNLPEACEAPYGDIVRAVIDGVKDLGGDISSSEQVQAFNLRDSIAKAMWDSYQYILNAQSVLP
ncbi:hypothetical protein DFH29DRAFT_816810, partial [Suillus ampliporus]